jgi:hypothetical protein
MTFSEIAKSLEAAVADAQKRQAAVDAAKAALSKAEEDYAAVRVLIQKLHADYQSIMEKVLSFGGSVHR